MLTQTQWIIGIAAVLLLGGLTWNFYSKKKPGMRKAPSMSHGVCTGKSAGSACSRMGNYGGRTPGQTRGKCCDDGTCYPLHQPCT